MNYAPKHKESIHSRILEYSYIPLCDAKLRVDSTRAVLQLLADHIERGIEIDACLLITLIHTADIGLAEASDAIASACCGGGR